LNRPLSKLAAVTNEGSWDHTVDLLGVGSGAGAMTTALCAHDRGGRTLLIEKSDRYGGSSAMSGGALWVPNNRPMAEAGVKDTPEEAMEYLRTVTQGRASEERLRAYVEQAPKMLEYLTEHSRLRVQPMLTYTDYYPEAPGGKPGGRAVEPERFDARLLGDEFDRLREASVQTLMMKRMSMTAAEATLLLARHPGWVGLTVRIMARYAFDLGGRLRSSRDRSLSLGNALAGMLRLSLMDRDIPVWLETPARELIVEDGRVVGVVAEREGRTIRIRALRGVVLAAGGFESSQARREKYLPGPTSAEWTVANPHNTGDAIDMALKLGAAVDLMDEAWWGPVTVAPPGEERSRMLFFEKCLPGGMFVNKRGERFVNEASPYTDVVKAMYEKNTPSAPSIPGYMVFDGLYRRKYPFGPFLSAAQQPDWALPKALKGYLKKASTLEGLAGELGIDADGLKLSVQRMNEYARTGTDLDFHRGESLFDRFYGDENVKPNPCLGPLEKPPYYGIEIYPGDLGTKGGLKTDVRARVLTEAGDVIPGLYATGNCSAAVMGPTYPGAGSTIGPAMTFGYVAALDAIPS
jgi:3-oxosteroid 1-dehydrogenase